MTRQEAEQIFGPFEQWSGSERKSFVAVLTEKDLEDEFCFDIAGPFNSHLEPEVRKAWMKKWDGLRELRGHRRFTRFSHFTMPALEIFNPTITQRQFIRGVMLDNHIYSPHYIAREGSGAFLQSDSETYILIEFWEPKYHKFMAYIDEHWPKE